MYGLAGQLTNRGAEKEREKLKLIKEILSLRRSAELTPKPGGEVFDHKHQPAIKEKGL